MPMIVRVLFRVLDTVRSSFGTVLHILFRRWWTLYLGLLWTPRLTLLYTKDFSRCERKETVMHCLLRSLFFLIPILWERKRMGTGFLFTSPLPFLRIEYLVFLLPLGWWWFDCSFAHWWNCNAFQLCWNVSCGSRFERKIRSCHLGTEKSLVNKKHKKIIKRTRLFSTLFHFFFCVCVCGAVRNSLLGSSCASAVSSVMIRRRDPLRIGIGCSDRREDTDTTWRNWFPKRYWTDSERFRLR